MVIIYNTLNYILYVVLILVHISFKIYILFWLEIYKTRAKSSFESDNDERT